MKWSKIKNSEWENENDYSKFVIFWEKRNFLVRLFTKKTITCHVAYINFRGSIIHLEDKNITEEDLFLTLLKGSLTKYLPTDIVNGMKDLRERYRTAIGIDLSSVK